MEELRDNDGKMEETQASIAAVGRFWVYGLEIASQAEEKRLAGIANELLAEAVVLEDEAERLHKKWKGRESAFARLCNGTCNCNLLTGAEHQDRVERSNV